MENKNLKEKIEKIFKADERFWDKERKVLLRNTISDSAEKFDKKLLEMLLSDQAVKEHFFKKIGKAIVFDKDKFLVYINNKDFLENSYTKFTQNIGLTEEGQFLKSSGKVILNWPYKDCILEGGQTKEDDKRNEIFFNEILEKDEIDVLLKPKVFSKFKKYSRKNGKVKGEKLEKFTRDENGIIKDNLIIKGNNLIVLHSLKEEFTGKVKLIYIDSPYNTGNDSFRYNDNFNHSTWLTFMRNRLEVAKKLLREDGIIFVQCDNHEQAYLKVLMDEIFEKENFITTVLVKSKTPSGVGQESYIFDVLENIHCYAKNNEKLESNNYKIFDEVIDKESKTVKNYHYLIKNFGSKASEFKLKTGSGKSIKVVKLRNFKYKNNPIKKTTREWVYENYEKIFRVSPANGGLMKKITPKLPKEPCYIQYTPSKGKYANKLIKIYFINREMVVMLSESSEKDRKNKLVNKLVNIHNNWTTESLWQGIANEGGIKMKNGKKPEKLLYRILDIATEKNDIVLDFFGGAGTTGAVAHKMGLQYILVEQMDYIRELPELRLKNVIEGDQTGISKLVNWKGGGEFVYMEMKEFNQEYLSAIKKANKKEDLKKIYEDIKEKAFLSYRFSDKEFEAKISEFNDLDLNEQKQVLAELLDKNQLYIPHTEIKDETFKISKKDIEVNKSFYNKK